MSHLSEFLVKRRHELEMTQKELASKGGISTDAIAKYERGTRRPKLEVLLKCSRVYHVSIYKLVDLEIEDIKGGGRND